MNGIWETMQGPVLACLLLPGLLVYLGLHVVRRGVVFVDLAMAQVAALGICLALVLGHDARDWQTAAWSGAFTLVGAAVLTLTRAAGRHASQEALIGIVYVASAAAGILLLSRSPEGNEELRRTLIGEVLLVTPAELVRAGAVFALAGLVHFLCRRPFLRLSYDPEAARAAGQRIWLWDFLFYAIFGAVVTVFVRIGGVLLVFSYLIVPAVCAGLFCARPGPQLAIGWIVATVGGMAGLYGSYRLDLPTGAAIVCSLAIALVAALAVRALRPRAGVLRSPAIKSDGPGG